jgi:hypothetical protein
MPSCEKPDRPPGHEDAPGAPGRRRGKLSDVLPLTTIEASPWPRRRRPEGGPGGGPSPPAYWPPACRGTRGTAAAPLPQSQARWDGRARRLLDQDGRRRRHHPANEVGRLPRSRLTETPASRRPPATVSGGEGRAFGACCFAGKLRSPADPGPVPSWAEAVAPTLDPTRNPTPATRVPLRRPEAGSPLVGRRSSGWRSLRPSGSLLSQGDTSRSRRRLGS